MDFEKGLIAAILRQGYEAYADARLPEDALSPQANLVLRAIDQHYLRYGKTFDLKTVEFLAETSFHDAPVEEIDYWKKEINDRYLFGRVKDLCERTLSLNAKNPQAAINFVQQTLLDLDNNVPASAKLISIFDSELWEKAMSRIESGEMGIETPWPSLTERMGGFKPQDLIVIAARPSVGKTFLWLMLLIHAWKKGRRVLAVTTEMSMESMVLRATATATSTSYGRTRKGRLVSYEKSYIRDTLAKAKESGDQERFMMMGDGFDVYLESIEFKIQSFKPDIVAIDGAYLMRSHSVNEKDRFNRIAEMFNQFKAVAKRNNIPMIITTQLNRGTQGKGAGKKGLERLAFSDNVGMIADGVFFLNQEDEDKENKQMIIEIGKMREGDNYSDLVINWDFENQNFSEVSEDDLLRSKGPKVSSNWKTIRAPKEKVIDE